MKAFGWNKTLYCDLEEKERRKNELKLGGEGVNRSTEE